MREIIADSRMMHIGKNGEGDALRVVFQVVAEWEALYGAGGVWTLNVQRHGDALAYAAQDFTIEDGAALWVVTDADAAVVGEGRCELTYKIGDTVAKSRTYAFRVDRSLTGGGDVPDPVKGWQEALEERVAGKLDRPDGGSAGDVLTKTGDGEAWKKPTGENVVYIAKTGTDTYAVKRNASDENPMPFAELLAMAKAPSTTVAVFDRYRLPLAALTDTGMIFESVYSATVFTVLVMQDNSAYQQSVTVMSAPLTDALKIPAWALSENKPTYTASEVGAVASQQDVSDAGKVLTVGEDGKVAPKEGAGGSDLSMGLTSAQVGQIIKVKAVDDAGRPTQWEAADLPSGGGKTWTKILEVEITEATANFVVNGLDNYTDFIIFNDGLRNETTIDSAMDLDINDIRVGTGLVTVLKNGTVTYSWAKLTYDGFTWLTLASERAIDKRRNLSNAKMPYYVMPNIGKATSIHLQTPNSIYAPIAGKITIYGR